LLQASLSKIFGIFVSALKWIVVCNGDTSAVSAGVGTNSKNCGDGYRQHTWILQ